MFDWSAVTPIIAIAVSIVAIFISRKAAQKNVRLAIQQAIFKTVSDKAKDCNTMWENEPQNERDNKSAPHFKVMSELIISKELIDKSFSLFGDNYRSIEKYQDDYYYLFWKQLRTDLREWIRRTPSIADKLNDEYYSEQVRDLHQKFANHFEPTK
jgi:hypothetical protein